MVLPARTSPSPTRSDTGRISVRTLGGLTGGGSPGDPGRQAPGPASRRARESPFHGVSWKGLPFETGSGGGIRTPDLWVMSPTSCRCSTPRRGRQEGSPDGSGGRGRPRRPRLPRGRPRSTLRRCAGSRPGSGWDRVGPARSRPRAPPAPRRLPPGPGARSLSRSCSASAAAAPPGAARPRAPRTTLPPPGPPRGPPRPGGPPADPARGVLAGGARPRPSARLGSGRLPAVHPPPVNPVVCRGPSLLLAAGTLVSGRGSRLDAFSGSPARTWLPSGAGCPTTGPPAVRPARSSRTGASPPQRPAARGG